MHAGAFELAGPRDVGVLVETSLDFHQSQHLLAGMSGVDQGVDDRRVGAGAVQGLLDGQHLRVRGGLRKEGLHGSGEGVIGVMQQDVALADGGENILCAGGLDLGDLTVRGRHERTVLQVRAVHAAELKEHGQVQRAGQTVYLVLAYAELVGEQLGEERARGVRDLQADRRSEAAAQQLLLHGVEQVLGVILFHVDVLVTSHAEGAGLLDDHAREQGFQMRGDELFHGDEAVTLVLGLLVGHVVHRHQARQVARDLDAGEVRLAGGRVLHNHGQVDGTAGNVGERVGRIHGERRQDREHLLAVVAREALLLGGGELVPRQQDDALLLQFRQNGVDRVMCVLVLQTVCGLADRAQLLTRAQAGGRRHGDARVDTALQTGDADHEELVKVRGEDRGEVGALEQGHVFVLRAFEHALVELEPAELAVEETVLGQRCLAFLIDAAVVVVVFGNMLCDLAAQNCLRGCVKYLCHSLYRKLWRGRKTTERARIQRVFMLVRCWLVLSVLACSRHAVIGGEANETEHQTGSM